MTVNPDSIPRYAEPLDRELRDLADSYGVARHLCDDCTHMVELPTVKYCRPVRRQACVASHDVDGSCDAKWCDAPCFDCRLYKKATL